jgi:ABC-type transport system involved in multi-copper enzyme maturation permease subunit
MKLFALIKLSFQEALSRKVFLIFLGIVALCMILLVTYLQSAGMHNIVARLQPSSEDPEGVALREMLFSMQTGAFGAFFPFAVFFGIFITADIIPTMLEKGSIEIFLSKPLTRSTLLLGKIFGGMLVLATTIIVFVVGVWSVFGLSFGMWNQGLLLALFPALGAWLSLFSLATLFGLLTRSTAVVMIVAYFHGTLFTSLLFSRDALLFKFVTNEFGQAIINGLYWVLPQINDLAMLSTQLIQHKPIISFAPFIQAIAFSAGMLTLIVTLFKRKDL